MPGKISSRRPRVVDEKVHAVEEINLAHTHIRIQEQQVDVRILLLQAFLRALGDNVVGNAAKRLETEQSTFVTPLRANEAISPAISQPSPCCWKRHCT